VLDIYHGMMEVIDKRRTAPMGDHGTVLNVISWILLVISMCTLVARFCMKLSIKDKSRRFGYDDVFIALAAVSPPGPLSKHFTNIYRSLVWGKQ
jgi:hypothetical protein